MEQVFFFIFATLAVVSALGVILLRNPVHSAISLMVCLLQVAALFVLLRSPFLAVVQVFIYVGAVMVLFLFVLLVLDIKRAVVEIFSPMRKGLVLFVIVAIVLELEAFILLNPLKGPEVIGLAEEPRVESLGRLLFTKYLFPFEIVSVLLLVAMVGAIVMTREYRHK
ncbi:MAG: NADH-quinone oxidoreductase subunit J [Deltaproteobacteria bacterium]|nr:NADH-quinone oxidoreductase subunit J [Deltaproteobacteria bacterium]